MKARVIILVTLLSVLFMGRAEAQRCLSKMQGIELRAGLNEQDGYVLGVALSSYAKGGDKWVYGVEYLKTSHEYRNTTIPAAQFTAEGGYYYIGREKGGVLLRGSVSPCRVRDGELGRKDAV